MCAGEFISILEVAQMIAAETGAEVIPGIAHGNNPQVKTSSKIPNWYPAVSLEMGIKQLVALAERSPIHTYSFLERREREKSEQNIFNDTSV